MYIAINKRIFYIYLFVYERTSANEMRGRPQDNTYKGQTVTNLIYPFAVRIQKYKILKTARFLGANPMFALNKILTVELT